MSKYFRLHPRLAIIPMVFLQYMLDKLRLRRENTLPHPPDIKRVRLPKILNIPCQERDRVVHCAQGVAYGARAGDYFGYVIGADLMNN